MSKFIVLDSPEKFVLLSTCLSCFRDKYCNIPGFESFVSFSDDLINFLDSNLCVYECY